MLRVGRGQRLRLTRNYDESSTFIGWNSTTAPIGCEDDIVAAKGSSSKAQVNPFYVIT